MDSVISMVAIQQAEQIQKLIRRLENANEDLRRAQCERDKARDNEAALKAKIKALTGGRINGEPEPESCCYNG